MWADRRWVWRGGLKERIESPNDPFKKSRTKDVSLGISNMREKLGEESAKSGSGKEETSGGVPPVLKGKLLRGDRRTASSVGGTGRRVLLQAG